MAISTYRAVARWPIPTVAYQGSNDIGFAVDQNNRRRNFQSLAKLAFLANPALAALQHNTNSIKPEQCISEAAFRRAALKR